MYDFIMRKQWKNPPPGKEITLNQFASETVNYGSKYANLG